jgi:hypothetical protein
MTTTSPVMEWLAHGLPLTLICDLTTTADPQSHAINLTERPAGDLLLLESVDLRGYDHMRGRHAG